MSIVNEQEENMSHTIKLLLRISSHIFVAENGSRTVPWPHLELLNVWVFFVCWFLNKTMNMFSFNPLYLKYSMIPLFWIFVLFDLAILPTLTLFQTNCSTRFDR